MKKIFIVLAFLMVGMLAFGQSLSGAIESGFKVTSDSTGTKVQQFDWANGQPGWGNVKLKVVSESTSADLVIRSTDYATLSVPSMWITQKYFKDSLKILVGKTAAGLFATGYNGMGTIDTQGVVVSYTLPFGLSVGGSVPLTNTLTDISSLQKYKAAASFNYKGFSLVGIYENETVPVSTGAISFAKNNVWLGFEVQDAGGTTFFCPYFDIMLFGDKFEFTFDYNATFQSPIEGSETELWFNYWFKPEFRLLGRVNYVVDSTQAGGGYLKTREGFVIKPAKNVSVRAQLDSTWKASPTHALNVMFQHSF